MTQVETLTHDVVFAQRHQRRVNGVLPPFHAGPGGDSGELGKGVDKGRAAIRVPGIVHGVYADKNIAGAKRPGHALGQNPLGEFPRGELPVAG